MHEKTTSGKIKAGCGICITSQRKYVNQNGLTIWLGSIPAKYYPRTDESNYLIIEKWKN